MKLLLDTHALIWCDSDPGKLSPTAAPAIRDSANEVLIRLIRSLAPLLLLAVLAPEGIRAEGGPPADLKDFDYKAFTPKRDAKTGFVVGGKNETAIIRKLTHLNGRAIAELEADLRPEDPNRTEHRSRSGFLGKGEKLLDVLAADNELVVGRMGLTHQALARALKVAASAGGHFDKPRRVTYHGRKLEVGIISFKGFQLSPFLDGTRASQDAIVKNLDNGKEIRYGLLVPEMIERYGYYEGKGVPHRVEPGKVVEVFDFLKKRPAKE